MPSVGTATSVSIASGGSVSAPTAVGTIQLVGISVPTLSSSANIGLVISTISPVDGSIITQTLRTPNSVFASSEFLSSGPTAGNFYWALDPNTLIGADFLQIRTGTEASPVTQTPGVTFKLHIRSFV